MAPQLKNTITPVLAAIACGLSLIAMVRPPQAPVAHECDADALRERVAELERQLAERSAVPPPVLTSSSEGDRTRADVDARVESLEQAVASIARPAGNGESAPGDPASTATGAAGEVKLTKSGRPKRGTPEHLSWAKQRVLDPNLTPAERSDALGEIQKHGPEAYTDDVIQSMVVLGQSAEDPKVRENIWRQFDGAKSPVLASALRQALSGDGNADVREEAAEALDHYRDDPVIRAALEHAAANDPDEKVRWEALRALNKPLGSTKPTTKK